jgi:beta-lactamase class A
MGGRRGGVGQRHGPDHATGAGLGREAPGGQRSDAHGVQGRSPAQEREASGGRPGQPQWLEGHGALARRPGERVQRDAQGGVRPTGNTRPRGRTRRDARQRVIPWLRLVGGALAAVGVGVAVVAACGFLRPDEPGGPMAGLPLTTQVAGVTAVPAARVAQPTVQARQATNVATRATRTAGPKPAAGEVPAKGGELASERAARVTFSPRPPDGTLETLVANHLGPYADRLGADNFGVVVESMSSGERYAHNEAKLFASGSVYKLAVAAEVLRRVDLGELRLDDQITVQPADQLEAEPEGGLPVGEKVTIRRALEAMMTVSSNAAGYALMRQIGRGELNAQLAAAGMARTSVPLLGAPGRSLHPEWAVTTPADMALLLRQIATDKVLSPASRAELRRLLAIPEAIDPLVGAVPRQVLFSKTGQLDDATNVAALLQTGRGPVVLSVFTTAVGPGEAAELIAELGRALYARG